MLAKKPTSQVLYLSETYLIIKKIIKKIKENKIRTVYETREDDFTILELVLNPNCFFNKKERISAMLIKMRLNEDCKDLR